MGGSDSSPNFDRERSDAAAAPLGASVVVVKLLTEVREFGDGEFAGDRESSLWVCQYYKKSVNKFDIFIEEDLFTGKNSNLSGKQRGASEATRLKHRRCQCRCSGRIGGEAKATRRQGIE